MKSKNYTKEANITGQLTPPPSRPLVSWHHLSEILLRCFVLMNMGKSLAVAVFDNQLKQCFFLKLPYETPGAVPGDESSQIRLVLSVLLSQETGNVQRTWHHFGMKTTAYRSLSVIRGTFPTWQHIFKIPFCPKCRSTGSFTCALHIWITLFRIYSRKPRSLSFLLHFLILCSPWHLRSCLN